MKSQMTHYPLLLLLLSLVSWVHQQSAFSQMTDQLASIFESGHVKVTIPHHGGYAATTFGKSVLRIQRQKNDSTYQLKYKDAIDRRKLELIINQQEYDTLKSLFVKLIEIHNPDKKLSGNCMDIDHNFILESSNQTLVIKPEKLLPVHNCVMNWLYSKELNN
ncbi:hypothetical protein KEM09_12875 [Carboxylicivirga mesophila]|uniref:Uncharacterized protein n=1 Tax=Carboxylicivirga mesophila TaxID=1166478 RepID=A0ABS5KBV2_9BACT|nr:hypothetical protein [Carboxylicivirga mesophila]MBS2212302.1 hypothetical protein [Carboxylicivirga mesophila]